MIQNVRVELPEHSYDIRIGSGSLREVENPENIRTLLVTDSTVKKLHAEKIARAVNAEEIFCFPAGEGSKKPETALEICRFAARLGFDRKCRFAAAGGGVTGDLTGFAAAIYMRGIRFIQIPTTLLAAVDSSVGGKTGADIPEGKNLVGAFHQPDQVIIDTGLLETLPAEELGNGLAEIVKTAVILDPELFAFLEEDPGSLTGKPDFRGRYEEIIRRCCELKARIVAEDEKESGRRAILNYGHTFGHAVELLSNYTLPHGQAVSIGMAAAGELAAAAGIWQPEDALRQKQLLVRLNLPVRLAPGYKTGELIGAMMRDKKNLNGSIRAVLCDKIGNAMLPAAFSAEELAAAWEKIR